MRERMSEGVAGGHRISPMRVREWKGDEEVQKGVGMITLDSYGMFTVRRLVDKVRVSDA